MKKSIILICFLLVIKLLSAQELAPVVIASAGKELKVETYSIAFTVGEIAIKTIAGNNHILTQGFHQPPGLYLSDITKNSSLDVSLSVYPNPTTDLINIVIKNFTSNEDLILKVYNSVGQEINVKMVKKNEQSDLIFTLDFSNQNQGTYFVRLFSNEAFSKYIDFKVIKVNN